MSTPASWEDRLALARERLAPALVMVGEWAGTGHAHGDPVTARLRVRPILDGTALEVWESVGAHEDLSLYRYDPDDGQLKVLHLMAGATAEHPVELTADGMVWVTPPEQPSVVWTLLASPAGWSLQSEVVWPGQHVAEVLLRYERA